MTREMVKDFEDSLNEKQKKQFNILRLFWYNYVSVYLVTPQDTAIRMELHKLIQVPGISKLDIIEAMKNISGICKKRQELLNKFQVDELGVENLRDIDPLATSEERR